MKLASPLASPHSRRFIRYLLVGGLNTVFGFGVYSAFVLAGLPVWLALLLANVAGVLFNFLTVGRIVFRTTLRGRLPRFVAAYGCVYACNLLLLFLVRHWLQREIVAQALLTLPMAAFAYVLTSRFVFARPSTS